MKDTIFEVPEGGYKDIFYYSPSAKLIMSIDAPFYTILDVNKAYLEATNSTRELLVGKSVFAVFPPNPSDIGSKNIERTLFSFEEAIKTKQTHTMSNYRYDIPIPGTNDFEERYWTTSNTPILNAEGEVIYFIHSPANVTETYKLRQREKAGVLALNNQRQQLYSVFMQAPVGILILKGNDLFVELVNDNYLKLVGKKREEFENRPLLEGMPEVESQTFSSLLQGVLKTGVAYQGNELEVHIVRNGVPENLYFNFSYEPLVEADGRVSGVIAIAIDVTETIKSKHKLKEAEERARLAVDAVGLGTFDLDLQNGNMITSAQFDKIFGFNAPVHHSEYVNVIHPDDRETRTQAHKAAIEKGRIFYEARVIWPDETVHWMRVEGKVYYEGEKATRLLGTTLDITEQRNFGEEQRKLISLVDNSVDLMSILAVNGTNSYINKAGMRLLGFETEEQVETTPIAQLHTAEQLAFIEAEVLPSVMNKGSWAGTMMVKHLQSGEVFPVFNNCFRIDDPVSGKPIAVGAVMRDLRPELAAKQALADSEQLLRNITTAAPTALWMADKEGAITYVNQTWVDWTGTVFEDNLGEQWANAIYKDDRLRAIDKFLGDLRQRVLYETEFRLNHSDGTVHWCVATGKPQYDNNGKFTGYIGSCSDITEQKHLQQQKDDFIGIASHELKTPVTSIKAYTQILEKMLISQGNNREAGMIGKMDSQINRLTSLIGDLLDVTKINSGRLQFNDREFDFNSLIKELTDDLQHTFDKHTIIQNLEYTGMVYADRERISQVVTNLITNAIKYSPHADTIIVYASKEGNEVRLCVQDFGIGISQQKQERVFEQFYRVSGEMQHTFPGLGLGLYISSEIIKREGGRIWVNSKIGKGSTFCFALPVKKIQ
ncbi:PAS domain S-box-containing protein [Mucilaginibacter gracilis]|uniref:histidine kinase n=1 Tax=Mucilaginibacter gracilis TaxID=423350 RepID=A0A495J3S9_9SPHI|nr:PAS domain S-box protein [Mucilaginibacter gracilis]RKR83607.1 PAS domain S-box-containing protein [Mucilaginibacter gracilis]